jgi:hypothetical protein
MEQEATELGTTDKKVLPVLATTGSETAEMTDALRDELATKRVDRFASWSGGAGLSSGTGRRHWSRRRGSAPDAASPVANLLRAVFGEPGQVADRQRRGRETVPASTTSTAASALKSPPVIGTGIDALTCQEAQGQREVQRREALGRRNEGRRKALGQGKDWCREAEDLFSGDTVGGAVDCRIREQRGCHPGHLMNRVPWSGNVGKGDCSMGSLV